MRLLVALIALLILPALALATTDIPDIDLSFAEMPDGPFPRRCMVVPDGSGPPLSQATLDNGATLSAEITLTLVNFQGNPIVNYPPEDLWVENECGDIALCVLGSIADDETDFNGQTTFSGPFRAGGYSTPGCDMVVMVAGSPLVQGVFDLRLNSPDFNGDLLINLSDIATFVQAISTYTWAADLNSDGVINLTDITLMSQAIGAICP